MTTNTHPDPAASPAWLDADEPLDQRVESLLAELTVEEKAGQLHLGFELDSITHHNEIASGQVGAGYSHGANAVPGWVPIALASTIAGCQQVAWQEFRLGIPMLFGIDVVHGLWTTLPPSISPAGPVPNATSPRSSTCAAPCC